MKQKKAEQEEHLQWLEKKLQAEQEKQERLDTFELNSKTEIKSYDILYGPNQGHISAVSYGKVLIVEGYVTAQNTGIQYVLAKINDINAINVTQIVNTDELVHTARSSSACFPVFQCTLSAA